MPWTYVIPTGELMRNGIFEGVGYSGHGEGKDNPALQAVRDVGPIPCGEWQIQGPPVDTDSHGPFVLRLVPVHANTFGRSGFLIHGDSRSHPGEASHGCIILSRSLRERVWESGDRKLLVVLDGDVREGTA